MRWSVHGSAGVLLNEQLRDEDMQQLCDKDCKADYTVGGAWRWYLFCVQATSEHRAIMVSISI
jgi:hypothetical protein